MIIAVQQIQFRWQFNYLCWKQKQRKKNFRFCFFFLSNVGFDKIKRTSSALAFNGFCRAAFVALIFFPCSLLQNLVRKFVGNVNDINVLLIKCLYIIFRLYKIVHFKSASQTRHFDLLTHSSGLAHPFSITTA